MATVFVSSVQTGLEAIRAGARGGIESLGHQALMAETLGAVPVSPQRALLNRLGQADIYLLLVGPRYGERQASGLSATEEEFEEARRLGWPILILRMEGELEPDQAEFLRRASGGWEGGTLFGTFRDESDVGLAVVRALRNLAEQGPRTELIGAAQTRAEELALASGRVGSSYASVGIRVVLVPLMGQPLLDAVALEDQSLGNDLAAAARSTELAPQSLGIATRISAAGVMLEVGERHSSSGLQHLIGPRGEVVVEASVAGEDAFGSMRVVPERVETAVRSGTSFAEAVWARIDSRGAVEEVALTLAIPQAQHRVWGPDRAGRSLSMAGMFRMPEIAVAPVPPLVVRRGDLAGDETTMRLTAEIKRVFIDAGAVDEGERR